MNQFFLQGMGVALVTPFTPDGKVDYPRLAALLEYHIKAGTDFITVLGTTAETPTLSQKERLEVQHFVAEKVDGRIPLVVGIGGNCTASVVDRLNAGDLDGYSAILSVAPYYNKPTQTGLLKHFTAIADASPLPVILYNVPGRTGVNVTADTIIELASHPNIAAVKEASGCVEQAERIIKEAPEGFVVLSGDDALTLQLIRLGGKGVISVLGNAYPAEFAEMVHSALDGNFDKAAAIDSSFAALYKLLFVEGNPAGVKALMSCLMPDFGNHLRLPLTEVSAHTYSKIAEFAKNFKKNH